MFSIPRRTSGRPAAPRDRPPYLLRAEALNSVLGSRRRGRPAGPHRLELSATRARLAGFLTFCPSRMDGCTVAGEVIAAQEDDFYDGWITAEGQGPFKGGAGTPSPGRGKQQPSRLSHRLGR